MTRRSSGNRPVYMISVAAALAGVHPQTLRIYERKELINPQRSQGNTRLYSDDDIEQLKFIQQLTQVEGINLAGVTRIIEMQREIERVTEQLERAKRLLAARERQDAAQAARREVHTALVRIHGNVVARRLGDTYGREPR